MSPEIFTAEFKGADEVVYVFNPSDPRFADHVSGHIDRMTHADVAVLIAIAIEILAAAEGDDA